MMKFLIVITNKGLIVTIPSIAEGKLACIQHTIVFEVHPMI